MKTLCYPQMVTNTGPEEVKDLKKGVLEEPSPFSALLCAFEGCLCRQHQGLKGCRSQMVSLSLACGRVALFISFLDPRELCYLRGSLHFAPTFVKHPLT